MCCCTYLTGSDAIQQPLSNKALTEVLAEVNKVAPGCWLVREFRFEQQRWFRKPIVFYRWELLWKLQEPEWQVINFYRDGTDWSINHMVTAELIVAYLYAVAGTINKERQWATLKPA